MVQYKKLQHTNVVGISVTGHASEYSAHNGKNIVCAAVSTVCDMAAVGCYQYDPDTEVQQGNGFIKISCKATAETTAILSAALLELYRIQENYPSCFKGGNTNES